MLFIISFLLVFWIGVAMKIAKPRRYKYRLLGIKSGCELSNNSKRGAFKANSIALKEPTFVHVSFHTKYGLLFSGMFSSFFIILFRIEGLIKKKKNNLCKFMQRLSILVMVWLTVFFIVISH
jgi:hypothetical protein